MGKKNKKDKKIDDFTAEIFTSEDFQDMADQEDVEEVVSEKAESNDEEHEKDSEESIEEQQEESLDPEDDEDVEDVEDDETEEEPKKHIWKKVLLVLIAAVVIAYAGVSVYFMNHFYPETVLNGKDVSMFTVEQVEELQEQNIEKYMLRLLESDNDITIVKGTEISAVYERDGKVEELLKSQNPFLWVSFLWKEPVINEPVSMSYDEAKLENLIAEMECMVVEDQKPSVSAHPELQGDKFVVVDEKIGTQIDEEKFVAAVKDALSKAAPVLDLEAADCYYHAKYNIDSPEVAKACEEMNGYLGAEVTLQFTPFTEIVNASVISKWIHFDDEMNVTFNKDELRAYVTSLAEKYDTVGKTREFVTGKGDTVEVTGGNYGWKLDQETEYNTLLANIENKEIITREPAYLQTALTHEGYDFGTTYVEVDLTNQHMFFFQDGQLALESDIVTGNPYAGNATPQGVYSIVYKQMHVRLRGPKKEDGEYEWDSPVTYWMPFNGGIGLHDATWQSGFGGSRYTWAGSHGCVNLPWATADALYPLVDAGTPVVCHY